jgi:hypothetical protein
MASIVQKRSTPLLQNFTSESYLSRRWRSYIARCRYTDIHVSSVSPCCKGWVVLLLSICASAVVLSLSLSLVSIPNSNKKKVGMMKGLRKENFLDLPPLRIMLVIKMELVHFGNIIHRIEDFTCLGISGQEAGILTIPGKVWLGLKIDNLDEQVRQSSTLYRWLNSFNAMS